MKIIGITAHSILDSRGRETVEVVLTSDGAQTVASAPSGKSTGTKEAIERRDTDGSVTSALATVAEVVAPVITGRIFETQAEFDQTLLELDGTDTKSVLGANVTLPLSVAVARAFATESQEPLWKFIARSEGFTPSLPRLFMNVLNGGAHANFVLPFQEYIIIPRESVTRDAYRTATRLFEEIGKHVRERFPGAPTGDEGGYVPSFAHIDEPFQFLTEIIGQDADLAIDAAASELKEDETYRLCGVGYGTEELLELYASLQERFPIQSIEDPFSEDDDAGFVDIVSRLGDTTIIVGDDFTVTNERVVAEKAAQKSCTGVIIKPNQIGTLTETYATVRTAHRAGWRCIASHRSGETEDSCIADIAVAIGAYGIKAGAPSQKERRAKYDRLQAIETEMSP